MTKRSGISRRGFLARTAALGCSAAASPFITPITFASAPWDTRLVVILLRGGMDGLDVVQPYGDRHFSGYRKTLKTGAAADASDLDGYFALNKGLSPLMPLWASQELAFAHAVSTPYRDKRSHFDGQDLLEAGTSMDVGEMGVRDGWLNRMLTRVPGVQGRTAFAVGREDMIILNGDAPTSSWSPDSRLDLSDRGIMLLEQIYHDDPVFQAAAAEATELAESLDLGAVPEFDEDGSMVMNADMQQSVLKASSAGKAKALAQFAADRLNDDTRIAVFSIGGWDTHRSQTRGLGRGLGQLSDAVLTLKEGLGSNWQKTAVLAMTEFGRTARENGSKGTDHGTGGAMLLAGGAIRGGKVYGDWPGLADNNLYQHRDLLPTGDVRSYAAWVMRGMFGIETGEIEGHIFPSLDMGSDLRILA